LTARVLNIQRMSTEDGPGIRTTVFFKGCGLRCAWCHNPESISPKPQVQWIETKCIGCKTCITACPEKALSATPAGILIDRERCTGCGECALECPSTAMEFLGTEWRLEALIDEVEKDRAYFRNSGGGITASGGDPTIQAPFVAEFLRGCRERGMHTALDTCGSCPTQALDRLLPHADLVLYDLKLMDPMMHERYTGHVNDSVIQNILRVKDYIVRNGNLPELWIRTPLIPGATATTENIAAVGRFIAEKMDGVVKKWELCAFNNLCRDKYRRLGLEWEFKEARLLAREFLDEMSEAARSSGIDPLMVQWTGATRVETTVSRDEGNNDRLRPVKGCGSC
jgi:pyruvate formate lyase activating enzyme